MTHRIKFKLQNIYAQCVIFIFCILKLFDYNTARRTNAEWFCCESTIKRLSAFVLPVGKTGLPRRDKSRLTMTRFKFRQPETYFSTAPNSIFSLIARILSRISAASSKRRSWAAFCISFSNRLISFKASCSLLILLTFTLLLAFSS